MADTHETIADVVAWLRRPREGENAYLTLWRDEIADRIEAAHKREVGDAAKLREAIITIRDKAHEQYVNDYGIDTVWIQDVANAALAAPPRNCDRFATVKEATEAFARERQDMPHPCPDFTFSRWLLTPVKKEGGAK